MYCTSYGLLGRVRTLRNGDNEHHEPVGIVLDFGNNTGSMCEVYVAMGTNGPWLGAV